MQNEELRGAQAEEKYCSIYENAVEGIFQTALDGRILAANPGIARMLGYESPEQLMAEVTNIQKFCVEPSRRLELVRLMQAYGGANDFEAQLCRKDGSKIWVLINARAIRDPGGKLVGLEEMLADITKRKLAEVEYKTILSTAMDGFWLADKQGRFLDVNEAYCRLIGYSRNELLKMSIRDVEAVETSEETAQHIARIMEVGWDRFETRHRCKDGRIVNIEVSANYMDVGGGRLFVFLRDLTDRKRAEEISLENERLALASKAKSEFLATMSHELRTPLNAIIGFSELMGQTSGELNEKQARYVNNVLTSGKRLLNLINDILDLCRIEAGKIDLVIEMMSVAAAIDETLILIKEKAARRGVIIKKEFDPSLEFIEADRQRFKQILFNLLDNAVKFIKKEGGIVTITAKKEGDLAKISVSDTGIGIGEEDMERLFKTFEQLDSGTSRKYGGTGLGLSISKQLVEMHGGKIWAESMFGEGSTFTFILPIVAKK